jgi:hypothetical protein
MVQGAFLRWQHREKQLSKTHFQELTTKGLTPSPPLTSDFHYFLVCINEKKKTVDDKLTWKEKEKVGGG